MSESSSERSPRDRQVDALIAEFELAAEQGRPLNREEFLKQHAEYALELREYLDDISCLRAAVKPIQPEPEETELFSGSAPGTLQPGMQVRYFGDYEILEVLGAGGMGVVYKARQTKLKRLVALKMIKRGQFASAEEVGRFQAEARAAAKLDHPGIVGVIEVGLHHGEHYYAMDFVAGGSLSMLYREQAVAVRHAAELVKKLAEAMNYAHDQGIVHRDLKPANVLLNTQGDPRITDFGLAKRLWSNDDSEGVNVTETGQVLGTAGYMSPEQASGKTRLVGPPADIYALGAILYAMLTTRAPFVGESQADTILQVIQKEPISPRTLNPSVPRDLETICIKCLEKEPHKRYGTAQLLADDLGRFLEGRPVIARPISSPARAWRWCRRKPALAGLWATAALLALTFALGGPIVAAIVASKNSELTSTNSALKDATAISNRRRIEAEAAQKLASSKRIEAETATEKERLANLQTQKRLAQLKKANELLRAIFYDLDPRSKEHETLSLRVILGRRLIRVADDMEKDDIGDPLVVAEMQQNLSSSLYALGFPAESKRLQEKAYKTRLLQLGAKHEDTLLSMTCLADSYFSSGQAQKGMELQEQALTIMREVLPLDHPNRTSALNNLARVYSAMDRIPEAIVLLEECFEVHKKSLGPNHLDTLATQSNLAELYTIAGEFDKSLALQQAAVRSMQHTLPKDHPSLLAALGNLARAYVAAKRFAEGINLYRETLPMMDQKWGPTHVQTVRYMFNLGSSYRSAGQQDEGILAYEETLRRMSRNLNQNPADRIEVMRELAKTYIAAGRENEAMSLYEKMLDEARSLPVEMLSARLEILGSVARAYLKSGRVEPALKLIDEYRASGDPSDVRSQRVLRVFYIELGDEHRNLGQAPLQLAAYQKALEICKKVVEADPGSVQDKRELYVNYHRIAVVYENEKEYKSAIEMYGLCLQMLQQLHQQQQLQPASQSFMRKVESDIQRCQLSLTALGEWETLLKQPPALLPKLLNIRCILSFELGRVPDALQSAAKLRQQKTANGVQLYNAACTYSLCAASIKAKDKELTAEQSASRQKHINDALATLREAIAAGFNEYDTLENDPNLAPLRDLPEFQKLLPAN